MKSAFIKTLGENNITYQGVITFDVDNWEAFYDKYIEFMQRVNKINSFEILLFQPLP